MSNLFKNKNSIKSSISDNDLTKNKNEKIKKLQKKHQELEVQNQNIVSQIKQNEQILYNILKKSKKENRNFLEKLQNSINSKTNFEIDLEDEFIKTHYKTIIKILKEKGYSSNNKEDKNIYNDNTKSINSIRFQDKDSSSILAMNYAKIFTN